MRNLVILGGYGNFGKRIAQHLCQHKTKTIYIAGRNQAKAEAACASLSELTDHQKLIPLKLNTEGLDFMSSLKAVSPDILIHTAGPFQRQHYHVPQACIDADCHYIDLADDRRFVCDIGQLNQQAKDKNLLVVSGASSVPGLSSTVISQLALEYKSLETIDIAIAPGNKAERGMATLTGILSYTGHPFASFIDGQWQTIYGWMSSRQIDFGESVGKRWLANVDVPDLELFPGFYAGIKTVRFQAGLELALLHRTMEMMAWLAKKKWVKNWAPLAPLIFKISQGFNFFGSDIGGMRVQLDGINHNNQQQQTQWTLIAENGIGPFIPTFPSIILANKLIAGDITDYGAKPCLNLFSLTEFDFIAGPLGIYNKTIRENITQPVSPLTAANPTGANRG
ncbi:KR domain-containing protein [Aliikangiella coralliicola]|uniref:KR domain-containing protein n=1 Tax=Aliikangiella coralliicola TaxID=2592383 RepID=A0A545U872_9GAMM|nr:KR domain-containing protein [Aliikangiella coralliicola]